jgi:hypothetical protein
MSKSRKTALNPSANRAGWSAATPGIRVGRLQQDTKGRRNNN